jgi:signal transduction histidine kinase
VHSAGSNGFRHGFVTHSPAANLLLRLLERDAAAFEDFVSLVTVQLEEGSAVQEPGKPAAHVFFPVDCVVSLISRMEDGASTEVALLGREGMVGLGSVLGGVETTEAVVQVGGEALMLPSGVVRRARAKSSSVRMVLDLYTEARLIQVAQAAVCNRLHSVDARLARWLLEIRERIDSDSIAVSHESIAQMLGVHRPTVSVALQRLQADGVIGRHRRLVVIEDRQGLERMACECRDVLRHEFTRLLSPQAVQRRDPHEPSSGDSDVAPTSALETMREIAGRLLLANIREQEARERLEQANQAKEQFLAMVSHELRTPLNAILGWSAVLMSDKQQTPDKGLAIIHRNAQLQMKLVDDLLDAVRLTSASLSIQPMRLSVRQLTQDVVDTLAPGATEKNVTIRVTIADEPGEIFGDADRLRQVWLNVLTNALKFTDSGGWIEVRVTAIEPGGIQVTVQDSGRGISEAMLPHVFERFRQGSVRADGTRGLGLGLTIARAIVELHGGTITMTSAGEGCGATCTIRLPAAFVNDIDV